MKETTKNSIKAAFKTVSGLWAKLPNPVQTIIICTMLQAAGVPTEACQAISSVI